MTAVAPGDGRPVLFPFGDGALLFSPDRRELRWLNATAAVIWCLREDGHDADGIAAVLRADAGLQPERARGFVAAALAEWSRADAAPRGGGPVPDATPPMPVAWPRGGPAVRRVYAIGPVTVEVAFGSLGLAAVLMPVLSHLETTAADAHARLAIVETPDGIAIHRDGVRRALCGPADELAPLALAEAWTAALGGGHFLFNIHAGVVANGTGCVLLPAAAGSGKTTLTAALVHAGLDFFSDEVAPLADPAFEVTPFPLPFCVKEAGLSPVAAFFPEARRLPFHQRGDGRRVRYLPPPPDRLPPPDARRPVRAIVFPSYAPDDPRGRLRRLDPTEALPLFLAQCVGVAAELDTARVARMLHWFNGVPRFELGFANLAWAVDAVLDVMA